MEQSDLIQKSLGEIVSDDFRAAGVFKRAGIDFCCGGKKTLGEACKEKDLYPGSLVSELEALEESPASHGHNFKEWSLDFLADYITNTHHKYVLKTLPDLVFYTQKIAAVHGGHHTELTEVADLFARINEELLQHLRNEEEVLFPAIKFALVEPNQENRSVILSEINRMSGEHEFAGGAMDHINEITGGYKVPDDGCNTYRVTMQLLEQFEDDLHVHVHLENNILFPKARAL